MFEKQNFLQERSQEEQAGRCHICTGCGRCPRGSGPIQVIADFSIPERREWEADEIQGTVVAVDIGTTTIAMALYDSAGKELDRFITVNPQVCYGADVLSRIQAAENPGASRDMRESVIRVLEEGVERFLRIKERRGETLLPQMIIAANTTMVYLLSGYSLHELGQAPFTVSHLEMVTTQIAGLQTVILPGLSAFVGADIMAGIYAGGMAESKEITLLIDLGTNGEMAVGNSERITACATAAGPAFEGGATRGIWGADMVHLMARLRKEGVLDETGLMIEEYFDQGIRIGDVKITQQAVRSFQLAKGAVAAGIDLLLKKHGLTSPEQVDRVILAGGFGYHLNGQDAALVGLFPQLLTSKVEAGGNTALAGALRYGRTLLQEKAQGECHVRTVLDKIRSISQIINLAQIKEFESRFLEAMSLQAW